MLQGSLRVLENVKLSFIETVHYSGKMDFDSRSTNLILREATQKGNMIECNTEDRMYVVCDLKIDFDTH